MVFSNCANPVGGDVTGVEAVSQLRHAQSDELVDQGEGHLVRRRWSGGGWEEKE